jgi:hypothetical protein
VSIDHNITKQTNINKNLNRHDFVKTAAIGGIGLGLIE